MRRFWSGRNPRDANFNLEMAEDVVGPNWPSGQKRQSGWSPQEQGKMAKWPNHAAAKL